MAVEAGSLDTTSVRPIELDWYSEEEIVRVQPRDKQRFEVQKDKVIEQLKLANHAQSQVTLLLNRLGEWMRSHASDVSAAYLTVQDAGFFFVVIQKSPECNDDLEDALSDLDLAVANDADLDLLTLNVIALPPVADESLRSFLSEQFLLTYRGDRG